MAKVSPSAKVTLFYGTNIFIIMSTFISTSNDYFSIYYFISFQYSLQMCNCTNACSASCRSDTSPSQRDFSTPRLLRLRTSTWMRIINLNEETVSRGVMWCIIHAVTESEIKRERAFYKELLVSRLISYLTLFCTTFFFSLFSCLFFLAKIHGCRVDEYLCVSRIILNINFGEER